MYKERSGPVQPPCLSVMVYIHGGAFCIGSSDPRLYGPELLIGEGLVFVSVNYRLGPLGFFALGNDSAPGNQVIKPQGSQSSNSIAIDNHSGAFLGPARSSSCPGMGPREHRGIWRGQRECDHHGRVGRINVVLLTLGEVFYNFGMPISKSLHQWTL